MAGRVAEGPATTGDSTSSRFLWYCWREAILGDDREPSISLPDERIGTAAFRAFGGMARQRAFNELH